MAIVSPSTTTGQALYDGTQSFRSHDDAGDSKDTAGVYSHNAYEFSATELEEILDALRYTISKVQPIDDPLVTSLIYA